MSLNDGSSESWSSGFGRWVDIHSFSQSVRAHTSEWDPNMNIANFIFDRKGPPYIDKTRAFAFRPIHF